MGGAIKALLAHDGRTILARQVGALTAAGVVDIALAVAAAADPALLAAAREARLAIVRDAIPDQGPLGGLAAALAWSPAPALVCLAGDLPSVSSRLVGEIARRLVDHDAVVPRLATGVEPLCAGYGSRCAAVVVERLARGQLRARELPDALVAAGLRVDWIDEQEVRGFDSDLASFRNWNRPSDLG
jgi:molybdopterin-guanine dinucleotide biosynthesis protein A